MTDEALDSAEWSTRQSALHAWGKLQPSSPPPTRIELLKPRRFKKGKKSYVFRLDGVGDGASSVIAKLCLRPSGDLETLLYSEVLRTVPEFSLRFYGSVQEPQADMVWLFIEYALGERYAQPDRDHALLVASWLGRLHAATSRSAEGRLPKRDAAQYFDWMQQARSRLAAGLQYRSDPSALDVLRSVDVTLQLIQEQWVGVESMCSQVPMSVVHGDFNRKHLVIRNPEARPRLAVFDWEYAGWGLIALDLGSLLEPGRTVEVNELLDPQPEFDQLIAYRNEIRSVWPHLGLGELMQMAKLGRVLRRIAAIFWASASLRSDYGNKTIERLQGLNSELSWLMRNPTDLEYVRSHASTKETGLSTATLGVVDPPGFGEPDDLRGESA